MRTDREIENVTRIGERSPEEIAEAEAAARGRQDFFRDLKRDGLILRLIVVAQQLEQLHFSLAEGEVTALIAAGVLSQRVLAACRSNDWGSALLVVAALRLLGRPKDPDLAAKYDELMNRHPTK